MVYKQQKYNLIREELEGCTKIIKILQDLPPPPKNISGYIQNVSSLVGSFDLDPNRVIGIVLEVFEGQTWNLSFLQILQQFKPDKIRDVLGNMYKSYHEKGDDVKVENGTNPSDGKAQTPLENKTNRAAPQSLYALTALLVATNIISIKEILPYLNPSAEESGKIAIQEEKDMLKKIKTFASTELNKQNEANKKFLESSLEPTFGTSASTSSLSKAGLSSTGLSSSQSGSNLNNKSDSANSLSKDTKAASTGTKTVLTTNYEIEDPERYCNGNQIAGLLAALLAIRCMNAAMPLFALLEESGVQVMNFKGVRKAMIDLLSWSIGDLYEPVSKKHMNLAKASLQPISNVVPTLPRQFKKFTSFRNLPDELAPTLNILGYWICDSPALFTQICRLFKRYLDMQMSTLSEDKMKDSLSTLLNIFSEIMLPALSIGEPNAFLTDQLWKPFGMLPFKLRFQCYDKWNGSGVGKDGIGSKPYHQSLAEEKSLFYSRRLLKRLQKENVRQTGRQLAIETHSNAMVAYNIVLNQIQNFDNLIPHIVDALKYSTALARDAMAYCLVTQLQKDSEKTKKDATHTPWFTALAKFTGAFYRKYYNTEIKGLFFLILKSLGKGESYDLLLLKELLVRMGGCESILDISDAALESLSGGKVLKGEVTVSFEPPAKKAQVLLRDELLKSETAIPILLFMAKMRSKILNDVDTPELKLTSTMSDSCQDLLIQYSDFLLGSGLSPKAMESISTSMPSLNALIEEIGLTLPVAFQLVRPLMRAALSYCEEVTSAPKYLQMWHPFHSDIIATLKKNMPEETWTVMSVELFVIFWTLNLNDILIPAAKYDTETKRLRDRYGEIDKNLSSSSDTKANKEKKAEMSKLLSTIIDLSDELENQQKHVARIKAMITSRNNQFFAQQVDPSKVTKTLLQVCVLPRVLMSPPDSVFSSQFVLLLHMLETPGFSTLQVMDNLLRTISPLIFSTTEAEAAFLGYIINDILIVINKWLGNKTLFEQEAQQKAVFCIGLPAVKVTFEEYQNIYKEWHQKLQVLLTKSLGAGLQQRKREYMHIRSGLVFLSKIVNNFPTRIVGGNEVLNQVEIVEKEEMEKRSDLSLFAKRLGSIMQKRKSTWVDHNGNTVSSSLAASKTNSSSNSIAAEVTSKTVVSSSSSSSSSKSKSTSSNSHEASNSKANEKLAVSTSATPTTASAKPKEEKEVGQKRERERVNEKEKNKERKTEDNKASNDKDNTSASSKDSKIKSEGASTSSSDKNKGNDTSHKGASTSSSSSTDKNKGNDTGHKGASSSSSSSTDKNKGNDTSHKGASSSSSSSTDKNKGNDSKTKDSSGSTNNEKGKDNSNNKGNSEQSKDRSSSSQDTKGRSGSVSEKGIGQKRGRDDQDSRNLHSSVPSTNNSSSSTSNSTRLPSRSEKSSGPDRDRNDFRDHSHRDSYPPPPRDHRDSYPPPPARGSRDYRDPPRDSRDYRGNDRNSGRR